MTRLPTETVNFPVLVGDIGGTNARFALLSDPQAEPIIFPVAQTADFSSLEEAVQATILEQTSLRRVSAILAVAGLVEGDEIRLTNCPWVVRPTAFFAELGFSEMIVLNDFEAQALAVVALGAEHLEQIGGEAGDPQASRVVLGPGTGLGVAGLVHAGARWIPVPGEGGHMDLGPRTARDYAIWPHLETIGGRISGEQLLCGRGLVNIYRAIAATENITPILTDPAQITASALARTDPLTVETLDLFVTCLGRTAGDLALVFKSKGGIFLAGGIAQKIVPALRTGAFRAAFDDKAPHRHLLEAMPVFVVTHPLAALVGLAAFASAPGRFSLDLNGRHWTA